MRVGLIYNLKNANLDPADERGAEWDEPETINAILKALSTEHEVVPIVADHEIYPKLQGSRLDFVFNVAEGLTGPNREAHVPAILEFLGIPYTGSDPFTLSACLDKARAKEILNYYRIGTPRFEVIRRIQDCQWRGSFPAIVKPLWEGSSIGVHNACWVENSRELFDRVQTMLSHYEEPVIVEEVLVGREFTVALMGNGDDLVVLPLVEIALNVLPQSAHPIYSYEAKWVWDVKENPLEIFQCPALVDAPLMNAIESIAKGAYNALGCRDWCRVDVRLDAAGIPHILELNPLPGILPDPKQNSCFPKASRAAGMNYSSMILRVLEAAMKRYGLTKPFNDVSSASTSQRSCAGYTALIPTLESCKDPEDGQPHRGYA